MSPLTPAATSARVKPDVAEENPELIRFRDEWLAELRRQGKVLPTGSAAASTSKEGRVVEITAIGDHTSTPVSSQSSRDELIPRLEALSSSSPPAKSQPARTLPTTHPAVKNGVIVKQFPTTKALDNALKTYRQAVEHEQLGELDQALLLYRQAFRLHDNVDRAYHREQMLMSILKEQKECVHRRVPSTEVEDLSASFESAVTIKPVARKAEAVIVTGTLATIVQNYPSDAKFEPENENEPILLNMIPDELLVAFVSKLDPTSVERFARVSKKARVLTLDTGIWRPLVRNTYQVPQIPNFETLLAAIEARSFDYRRVFIELPRLRLDGVYIATCHYVRPGLSENHWVNVSHLITYHRYLRFFSNGQVLSLLANEEHAPQQVIPLLKPTLRMKGLFLGQWRLDGTTVYVSNLVDASGRFTVPGLDDPPIEISSNITTASGIPMRYVFTMTLDLRSRPLGRWNRMDIQSYDSVNIETGDVYPVALKHERPFWFSKVRSYA